MARPRTHEDFETRLVEDHITSDESTSTHFENNGPENGYRNNFVDEVSEYIQNPRILEDFKGSTVAKFNQDHSGEWKLDTETLEWDIKAVAHAFKEAVNDLGLSDSQINTAAEQVADQVLADMTISIQAMEAEQAYNPKQRNASAVYQRNLPSYQEDVKQALAQMAVGDGMNFQDAGDYITVTIEQAAEIAQTVFNPSRKEESDIATASHSQAEKPNWLRMFSDEELTALGERYGNHTLEFSAKIRIGKLIRAQSSHTPVQDEETMTEAETHQCRVEQATENIVEKIVEEIRERLHDESRKVQFDFEEGQNEQQWIAYKQQDIQQGMNYILREEHIERYGFPIITMEAIDWIKETVGDTPLVEIGAGNAYLSYEMQKQGIDVVATDPYTLDNTGYGLGRKQHTEVESLDAIQAFEQYPEKSVIWSWPEKERYVDEAFQAFRGERLIYIGENDDSCTGPSENIVYAMNGEYREIGEYYIPSFIGVRDNITIVERIDYEISENENNESFNSQWKQIGQNDLNQVMLNDIPPEIIEHILAEAAEHRFISRGYPETQSEHNQRNIEFSISHITKTIVSDAMKFADHELQQQVIGEIEAKGTNQQDWANEKVQAIIEATTEHHASEYGNTIITNDAARAVAAGVQHSKLIQVEAAQEYLANALRDQGIDIVTASSLPQADPYTDIINMDGMQLVETYPDRNMIWEGPKDEQYTAQIMNKFSGEYFVYIGDQNLTLDPEQILSWAQHDYELSQTIQLPKLGNRMDEIKVYQRV